MKKVGRKTKLTRDFIKRAENLIKAGNYVITVCGFLGVHESTWYRWMQEGEEAERGIKREFYESIKKAESEAEVRLITDLQRIGKERNDWTAIAWMLERKYPDRWGKKDRLQAEMNHSGSVDINTQIKDLTDEELNKLLAKYDLDD